MDHGLTTEQVQQKLKQFGKNEITSKQTVSPLKIFLSQFPTILNGVLVTAGIFAFVIGDILDGSFIFAVLIINGVFEFVQQYKAEKALEKLKDLVKPIARVIRNGKEEQIASIDIVPEDIIVLSEGDRIPADGYLLKNDDLEIDEAILTGESLPVAKQLKDTVMSGTLVVKGRGRMVVTAIGMETQFGKIAQTLQDIKVDETPLKHRLDVLGKILSVVAIVVAGLIIPIGIMQGRELFPIILIAISIAVAAIPQSLPAVITISLAIGTNRMAKKNAIVRKMPAVETLGAVQFILTDKTGTLTQNAMRVKKHFLYNNAPLNELLKAGVFGNTASLVTKNDTKKVDIVGDQTDGALLLYATEQIKDLQVLKDGGKILDEFVFDPNSKTVTTLWLEQGKRYVYVRGAPEKVIEKSNLPEHERTLLQKQYEDFAKEGLRVIAFANKHEVNETHVKREHLEDNLTFLGFVGIYDPPREEVKQAVHKAKTAGVQPIMVTGDNELTALAIAKEIGLIDKDEDVVTGEELGKMTDEQLSQIIEKTRIFARSKPEDKLRLVTAFKNKGYVIGVTGDGVNDALALKKADVGVAMGQTGTDVAKEASDIIITDDNFSTIVHAIEEGRRIYDNILKSTTYLISGNLSELSLIFLAVISGLPMPLIPTQILWINLVTDGLPALALAADHKDPDLLKRRPRNPQAPILTLPRIIFIGVVGFGLAQLLLIVFIFLLQTHSETFARTVVFNLLVFSHMGIAFLVRGKSAFRSNKILIFTVLATMILQLIITFVPFFHPIFEIGFN